MSSPVPPLFQVEKSLQRLHRGAKNAMYTSQKSIDNKVGAGVQGWRDLLISVGFRLEPGANGVPASVFFPQSDPGERLTQASASLQALLGLGHSAWCAMARMVEAEAGGEAEAADETIALFREVVARFADADEAQSPAPVEVTAGVRVWRAPGCHELLASLGFDLMGVGDEEVRLRSSGRGGGRRQAQFALQALLALFDTQDAPRCIDLEEEEEEDEEEEDSCSVSSAEQEQEASAAGLTFPPAPRKSDLVLGSEGGAFTSYVRSNGGHRGEPDGRQSGTNDSPPAPAYPATSIPPPPIPPLPAAAAAASGAPPPPPLSLYQNHHSKGHESDCNFTPSPVNPVGPRLYRGLYGAAGGHQHQHHGHAGPFTYGQQRRSSSSDHSPAASEQRQPQLFPLHQDSSNNSSANSSLADWKPVAAGAAAASPLRRNNLHLQSRFEQAMHGLTEAINGGQSSSNASSSGYAPLYENNEVTYSARQPAGKPVTPIRSVFTDVGYGSTQKIRERAFDPSDKFSVRAEAGKTQMSTNLPSALPLSGAQQQQQNTYEKILDSRLNPGVTKRMPPTGESDSPPSTLNNNMSVSAKRSSLSSMMNNADTASITTTSSANTFIVKSDDGAIGGGHKKVGSTASSSTTAAAVPDLSEINIQESLRSSQLRRLTMDSNMPPLSDAFHHDQQQQQGSLGLAPPLSRIIMSNNLQVVQVDHHSDSEGSSKNTSLQRPGTAAAEGAKGGNATVATEESFNSIDNASAIEAAHLLGRPPAPRDPPSKRRPPIPPKPSPEWNGGGVNGKPLTPPPPPPPQVNGRLAAAAGTRDDGDGRSMTDSQYSGYSPNGQPPKHGMQQQQLNGHHHHHHHHQHVVDKTAARMGYLKMQDYINQQDIITVVEEEDRQPQPITNGNGSNPALLNTVEKMVSSLEEVQQQQQPQQEPHPRSKLQQRSNQAPPPPAPRTLIGGQKIAAASDPQTTTNGIPANTKHPAQIWSRDKSGGLHYTGLFSSDC